MIVTAQVANNSVVFADICRLYVPEGSSILDSTYGLGAFYRDIDISKYKLTRNDLYIPGLELQADCRNLPVPDHSYDVFVLDPPYAHGSVTMKASLARRYGTGREYVSEKAIIQLYKDAAKEAHRILRPGGILILKTQDGIEAGKQYWKHIELAHLPCFDLIDLFVVVSTKLPMINRPKQLHGRKNHSYFMVFQQD